jgi:hypothetical protein
VSYFIDQRGVYRETVGDAELRDAASANPCLGILAQAKFVGRFMNGRRNQAGIAARSNVHHVAAEERYDAARSATK